MTLVFPMQNPLDACHALTMIWLARSMESRGVVTAAQMALDPVELLKDAYEEELFLGLHQGPISDADHERLALRFFGFALESVTAGVDARSNRAINQLLSYPGYSYFAITGGGLGHALGFRKHRHGCDLFDPNIGLHRWTEADRPKELLRAHLMRHYFFMTLSDWVIAEVPFRTVTWATTIAQVS